MGDSNTEKTPIKLSSISITGNGRTRLQFFQSELGEELSSCKDLGNLHAKVTEVTERLLGRNMFDAVESEIRLDSISNGVYDTSVVLNVKEKGYLQLQGSTYLKTGMFTLFLNHTSPENWFFKATARCSKPPRPGPNQSSLKYAFTLVDDRDSATSPTTGRLLQGSIEAAIPPGNAQFLKSEFQSQYHKTIGPSVNGQVGLVASICASAGIIYPLQRLNFFSPQDGKTKYRTYLSDKYQHGGPLSLRGFEVSGIGARAYSNISGATDDANRVTDLGDSMGGDCKSAFLFALSVPVVWPLKGSDLPSSSFPGLRAFAFVNAGSLGNSSYWTLSSLALANSEIPRKPVAEVSVQSTTVSTITTATATTTSSSSNAAVVSTPTPPSFQGKSMPFLGFLRASVGVGMSLSLSNVVRLEACYSLPVMYSPQDNLRTAQLGVGLTVN
eukprot:gene26227-34848_t